jgi:hypothetical protein
VPALGDANHGFPYLSGAGRLIALRTALQFAPLFFESAFGTAECTFAIVSFCRALGNRCFALVASHVAGALWSFPKVVRKGEGIRTTSGDTFKLDPRNEVQTILNERIAQLRSGCVNTSRLIVPYLHSMSAYGDIAITDERSRDARLLLICFVYSLEIDLLGAALRESC